eukprot:6830446-Pyramimonas_sp.AAC.1
MAISVRVLLVSGRFRSTACVTNGAMAEATNSTVTSSAPMITAAMMVEYPSCSDRITISSAAHVRNIRDAYINKTCFFTGINWKIVSTYEPRSAVAATAPGSYQ